MSEHTTDSGAAATDPDSTTSILDRTRFAIATALGRRDSLLVFAGVTVAYTLGYLYAVQQLFLDGSGFVVRVAHNPLGRFFQQANSAVNFEPVVLIETDFFTYLFSLNTPMGLGIGALVGLNLAITYLAWRQPKACGLGASSAGLLAGIPALLSGSACCGPILLLVVGIQATGTLVTAFQFLLPVAVLLLVGSLLLVGRQIDPALVSAA
jgi:hypothetical protein